MKRKYILFIICSFFLGGVSAQTLEQARTLFTKGDYEQAKPVFQKYAKSQPSNGNYSYWYGVCCLKTGEPEEAVKYLETAVKRRVAGGQLIWDKLTMILIVSKMQSTALKNISPTSANAKDRRKKLKLYWKRAKLTCVCSKE